MADDPELVVVNGKTFRRRYEIDFSATLSDLAIEQQMVECGGYLTTKKGVRRGNGPFFHYKRFQELAWPEDDHHEWSDLILKAAVQPELLDPSYAGNNQVVVMGPKDSGKSYTIARLALTDYWCHADETLILVSSTELRGAGLRIWGAMKDLFTRAREKHSWLPGKVLESKNCITTDDLKETEARDPRKGIIFMPMFGAGGQYLGLRQYAGVKQKRKWVIGDEAQFMPQQYMNVPAAVYQETGAIHERGTWFIFLGNPIGQGEPLDKFGEPIAGWGSEDQSPVTKHWRNKFGGVTLNLVGVDSPNMHHPKLKPKRFPYMVGLADIEWCKKTYGDESANFWTTVMGMRKAGMLARRVITPQICATFHASDDVIWEGSITQRALGVDCAYGSVGGDRCVIVPVEWGRALVPDPHTENNVRLGIVPSSTRIILKVFPPIIVPVSVRNPSPPEDQIVLFTKDTASRMGVLPENVFFDGRATMAMTFARLWSPQVNAVDFGGPATKRPVSLDHWTFDLDTRERRLKRCDEEYSKFVTELWFTTRLAVESNQIRGLPSELIEEGSQREWQVTRGDRKEVETKADMKVRTNQSPDLYDAFVAALEGARRRGFQISKLSESSVPGSNLWLTDASRHQADFRRKGSLATF